VVPIIRDHKEAGIRNSGCWCDGGLILCITDRRFVVLTGLNAGKCDKFVTLVLW